MTVGFLKTSLLIVYYYIVKSSNAIHFEKINKLEFFSYIQNFFHNIYYNYGVLTFLFLNHFSISNVLRRKIRIQTWCTKLFNEWTCLSQSYLLFKKFSSQDCVVMMINYYIIFISGIKLNFLTLRFFTLLFKFKFFIK